MISKKKFWLSKTFWINFIACTAIIIQSQTDFVIDPEKQTAILGFINLLLRFFTKEEISMS